MGVSAKPDIAHSLDDRCKYFALPRRNGAKVRRDVSPCLCGALETPVHLSVFLCGLLNRLVGSDEVREVAVRRARIGSFELVSLPGQTPFGYRDHAVVFLIRGVVPFNGAAAREPRKVGIRKAIPFRRASMGPRLASRGNQENE